MQNRYLVERDTQSLGIPSARGLGKGEGREEINQNIFNLKNAEICDVWGQNLESEILKIADLVESYNVISLVPFNFIQDTEFPGVTITPSMPKDEKDFEFKLIQENANALKVIQIGISLSNEFGDVPVPCNTWQFNFHFDLSQDQSRANSISLLQESGINFENLRKKGINPLKFAELMMCSGIVLNDKIKWIVFHGGFDFAYFLKTLTNEELPDNYQAYDYLCKLYFQNIYDIKYLIKDYNQFKSSGLTKMAYDFNIKRIGQMHQAGSDSLLTLQVYFKFISKFIESEQKLQSFNGIVYGIGRGHVDNKEYIQNYCNDYAQDYLESNYYTMNDFGFNFYGSSSQFIANPFMNNFNYLGYPNNFLEQISKQDMFQM